MSYPRRSISNPTFMEGSKQVCTWDATHQSASQLSAQLSDDDGSVRLSISEERDDGAHTARASVTLSRSEGLKLLKTLSGLI